MKSRYATIAAIGAVVLTYVVLISMLPKEVFWITDGGNKYMQLKNLELTGKSSMAYPASDVDEKELFFPFAGHHFRRIGENIYSFYPPYFSLISIPFHRIFGPAGLYFLPIVSSLVVLVFTFLLACRLGLDRVSPLIVLIIGLATPVFFYSLTFWEHTPALALSTAGLWLLVTCLEKTSPWKLFVGGILIALSIPLREEGYVLLAAVAAGFIFFQPETKTIAAVRNVLLVAIGAACIIIPLWLYQYLTYGHPLGIHALVYSELETGGHSLMNLLQTKATNFFVYLFRFHHDPLVNALMSIPPVALLILFLAWPRISAKNIDYGLFLTAISTIGALMLSLLLLNNPSPVRNTLNTQSLFGSMPFLILLAFALPFVMEKKPIIRFMLITTIVYIALTGLLVNQSDIGVVWGPRHFITILPIVVILTFVGVRKAMLLCTKRLQKVTLASCAVILLLCSLSNQLHSIHCLFTKKAASQTLAQAVREAPQDIIVTDAFWVPEELGALYFSKKVMYISSDQQLLRFTSLMREKDQTEFLFIRSRFFQSVRHNVTLREMLRDMSVITPGPSIKYEEVEFMEVQLINCHLRNRNDAK